MVMEAQMLFMLGLLWMAVCNNICILEYICLCSFWNLRILKSFWINL